MTVVFDSIRESIRRPRWIELKPAFLVTITSKVPHLGPQSLEFTRGRKRAKGAGHVPDCSCHHDRSSSSDRRSSFSRLSSSSCCCLAPVPSLVPFQASLPQARHIAFKTFRGNNNSGDEGSSGFGLHRPQYRIEAPHGKVESHQARSMVARSDPRHLCLAQYPLPRLGRSQSQSASRMTFFFIVHCAVKLTP